ncbi:MAG: wax ester/triacylglycerol synthase family O-acyltransferase [Deltaproteobacteria bacterium]|nr:wax ester/triacylglycerol synthase family O-acyltransferase [Deltaproteobacteria bacterium]MBW2448009.1 wax ester/triacylglycerol synthase family O-acyltransferase [Deltaproteobacteria bacterium]
MTRYAYDRLTALDHSFLLLEKPNAYMHVASTQIFEVGPLRTPEGGVDAQAIKDATAASLHQIPRYRQKLVKIPIEGRPVWVDDPTFNIDYHIRHTSLPRPGTERQLKRLSARIMQQHLDRRRPLWEIWIVEGLEGDRFALISKVHHCMIDGVSGVDLLRILMSPTPDQVIEEPPLFVPRPAPSGAELLVDEVKRRVTLPFQVLGDLGEFLSEARDVRRDMASRIRSISSMLGRTFRSASETPLNREIGPHRRFDWFSMDLADMKRLRRSLGGSLNDVVLTVVTGAVRRFLEGRQCDPTELSFRVMAPVSVRSKEEQGALGNRVSAWIIELPIGDEDPRTQLAKISEQTTQLKESKEAVAAKLLTQAAEFTPTALLALGARNATRVLPFNLVVTNVPGPQFPMYMLGAKMLEIYPHVPLLDYLGLGIALMSYDGQLHWGINADYDTMPDIHPFMEDIEAAYAELGKLADLAPVEPAPSPPSPRKPRGNGASATT